MQMKPLPTEEERQIIRDGVRSVVTRFDDSYWLARDDDGKFPFEFHKAMADAGWLGITMPEDFGGAGLGVTEAAIMMREVASHGGGMTAASSVHINLFGPHPIVVKGTPEQKRRWIPRLIAGEDQCCFGFTEPDAGLNTTRIKTFAEKVPGGYVVRGQKVWTSLAHWAQWCFVVARTEKGSKRHAGLSYLLVPLDQPGVEIRPIIQLTGDSEFNEVFFDDARTDADLVVGEPGDGWRVAMGTLTFERGVSTLGQQIRYAREHSNLVELARKTGAADDPLIRERLTRSWAGLRAMRSYALATMDEERPGQDSVSKLLWANWHRELGEIAMDVVGMAGLTLPEGEFDEWQRLYLFSRSDTIYGGSNEVQRNIIAERVLGLPGDLRADAGMAWKEIPRG